MASIQQVRLSAKHNRSKAASVVWSTDSKQRSRCEPWVHWMTPKLFIYLFILLLLLLLLSKFLHLHSARSHIYSTQSTVMRWIRMSSVCFLTLQVWYLESTSALLKACYLWNATAPHRHWCSSQILACSQRPTVMCTAMSPRRSRPPSRHRRVCKP